MGLVTGLFSQAAATVSWSKWILPKMCFPKWLLVLLMLLVNLKLVLTFATKLIWKAHLTLHMYCCP